MSSARVKKLKTIVEEKGILLVYPLQNRAFPRSIWSALYPRSKMNWDWDVTGDDRVVELWQMREELSREDGILYAKWFQGRATFFSARVASALIAAYQTRNRNEASYSQEARDISKILAMDSPMSTKEIKKQSGLQGRALESTYQKAMKELWLGLSICGRGEVHDSSFPSLAVGLTSSLHPEIWERAKKIETYEGIGLVESTIKKDESMLKFFRRHLPNPEGASANRASASVAKGKSGSRATGNRDISSLDFSSFEPRRKARP